MSILPRLVLPAVATLGVMYPASFLLGMWKSAESGDLEAPGAWRSGGELTAGWRFDIYERNFPKTYRVAMVNEAQDYGSLCILEVRGGDAKPVNVSAGQGSLVYVTMDKPLPGFGANRVSIDITEALRARCAGVVSNGNLYAGGAAEPLNQAAMGKAPAATYAVPQPAAAPAPDKDASLDVPLTPVSLSPTATVGM